MRKDPEDVTRSSKILRFLRLQMWEVGTCCVNAGVSLVGTEGPAVSREAGTFASWLLDLKGAADTKASVGYFQSPSLLYGFSGPCFRSQLHS